MARGAGTGLDAATVQPADLDNAVGGARQPALSGELLLSQIHDAIQQPVEPLAQLKLLLVAPADVVDDAVDEGLRLLLVLPHPLRVALRTSVAGADQKQQWQRSLRMGRPSAAESPARRRRGPARPQSFLTWTPRVWWPGPRTSCLLSGPDRLTVRVLRARPGGSIALVLLHRPRCRRDSAAAPAQWRRALARAPSMVDVGGCTTLQSQTAAAGCGGGTRSVHRSGAVPASLGSYR
jgi:hypothetical protein